MTTSIISSIRDLLVTADHQGNPVCLSDIRDRFGRPVRTSVLRATVSFVADKEFDVPFSTFSQDGKLYVQQGKITDKKHAPPTLPRQGSVSRKIYELMVIVKDTNNKVEVPEMSDRLGLPIPHTTLRSYVYKLRMDYFEPDHFRTIIEGGKLYIGIHQ